MEIQELAKRKINALATAAALTVPGETAPRGVAQFAESLAGKCLDMLECEDAGLLESAQDALEEMFETTSSVWGTRLALRIGLVQSDEPLPPGLGHYMLLVVGRCLDLIRQEAAGTTPSAYAAIAAEFGATSMVASRDAGLSGEANSSGPPSTPAPLRDLAKTSFCPATGLRLSAIESAAIAYRRWEQGQAHCT